MSDVSILITVTREEQLEIEEYCMNSGKKISDYLTGLHKAFMKSQPKKKEEPEEWVKELDASQEEIKKAAQKSKKK